MEELHYTCEHSNKNGHTMTLTWPDGIELVIDFTAGEGFVLNHGVVRRNFSTDISLNDFETIILQCEKDNAALARFSTRTRESIISECLKYIDLQSIVDDIFAYGIPEGRNSIDTDIELPDGAILSISAPYVLRTEYSTHTDPTRVNPDEYTLAFFEFYLEDGAEVLYRPANPDEKVLDLSDAIKLDEKTLESMVKEECKK